MGQGIFQFPTPDGYPDKTSPWLGTLMWRWNLAFTLAANQVPSVSVPLEKLLHAVGVESGGLPATNNAAGVPPEATAKLFRYFIGHDPSPDHLAALASITNVRDVAGLLVASPAFQRY